MKKDDNYYMMKAYKEALKAYELDEIPIGVVLVKDNKIICKSHNLRDSLNIVTKHAEIIAIEKANKIEKNWRLLNYTMYTTLEPCNMCNEVIKESKINKVIYGAKNFKSSNNIFYQIKNQKIIELCENLIKQKFNDIREKNISREIIS